MALLSRIRAMFIRTKRVTKKNGKTYIYRQLVHNVRVPGRRTPKQIYMGKREPRVGMYLSADKIAQNAADLARGWAVDRYTNKPEVADKPADSKPAEATPVSVSSSNEGDKNAAPSEGGKGEGEASE